MCALSSRERLLLPLVLGLRRWARVGVLQPLGSVAPPPPDPSCILSSSNILHLHLQICDVDCAEEGGLPPHVFALMVVFFLQQRREALLPTYLKQDVRSFLPLDSQRSGRVLLVAKRIPILPIVSRSRCFRSAGCLSSDSHMWRTDTCTGSTPLPPKKPHSRQKTPASQER